VGALLVKAGIRGFKKRLDYSEYGGAPLLGLKRGLYRRDGSSNANAIKNAIRIAAQFAESKVNAKIEQELTTKRGVGVS